MVRSAINLSLYRLIDNPPRFILWRMIQRAGVLVCFAAVGMSFLLSSCSTTKEAATKTVAPPKPLATFKVMSLNTVHALKNKSDVRRFVQWVKIIAPDVLALQEIDVPLEGKTDFDAPAEVAKQAEMYRFFGMARYWNGKNSGNALLSTYPIMSSRVEQLPVGKGKVRRSLAYGVVDLGVRSIAFASTELDEQSPAEREGQAKAIFRLAQRDSEFPLVVCGMFNEPPSGAAVLAMMEHFSLANVLNKKLDTSDQQIYAVRDSVLKPISVKQVSYDGTRTDAIVATFQILQ
jgi:endonuclease/exonuclease/phosphatase family metal-dependent hydrolase